MSSPVARLRIQQTHALGEATLLPRAATGRLEIDMARAMAAALGGLEPESASAAFTQLHLAFPETPPNVRLAALADIMQRRPFDS